MAFSTDYLEFILDQLSSFGPVTHKKMFGGVGLYREGLMFGGIMGGNLHFKVDAETRQEYLDREMGSFFAGQKGLPSYYEVPVEVIEDRDELARWAERAYAAAVRSKK